MGEDTGSGVVHWNFKRGVVITDRSSVYGDPGNDIERILSYNTTISLGSENVHGGFMGMEEGSKRGSISTIYSTITNSEEWC